MSVHTTNSHSVKSGAQDGCYNFGKSGSVELQQKVHIIN